jgi:DUF1009 family protein
MLDFIRRLFASEVALETRDLPKSLAPSNGRIIGVIAGSGTFPLHFIGEAKRAGCSVVVAAHLGETDESVEDVADRVEWVKVGELGRLVDFFLSNGCKEVAMAGGINRIRLFGGVKLDKRGAALIFRLRSTKDDIVMRGIADELATEGITVIPCTEFLTNCLVRSGLYTKTGLTPEEETDIRVGIEAIVAMGSQHIGQLVVVRDGVIVAVEAVEGSDATIKRGGELGGRGTVVVKFSKPTQDMRFDVPTVGLKTIETMAQAGCRVLALETGRCLFMDEDKAISLADRRGISVVGVNR